MKRHLPIMLFMLFVLMQGSSSASNQQTGTAGGAFLKISGGVRAAAMGEAFIAVPDGTGSIYYNPAGITSAATPEISSQYSSWLAGITKAGLSCTVPAPLFHLGISYGYINMGRIEETTLAQPGGTGRMIDPSARCIGVTAARKINDRLSIGASVKSLSEAIDSSELTGSAADLGMLFRVNGALNVGLIARNISGSLGVAGLPRNYGAGASLRIRDAVLACDYNIPSDNGPYLSIGAEVPLAKMFVLRAGYNTRSEEGAGGNFGAGIGLSLGGARFDYAYVPYGDIGETHRFAVSVVFGGGTKEAVVPDEQASRAETGAADIEEVRVFPELAELEIGEKAAFTAKFYDSSGKEVRQEAYWQAVGKTGKIDPYYGIFTATGKGTGLVAAYPRTAEMTVFPSSESERKKLSRFLGTQVSGTAQVKVAAKPEKKPKPAKKPLKKTKRRK